MFVVCESMAIDTVRILIAPGVRLLTELHPLVDRCYLAYYFLIAYLLCSDRAPRARH